MGFSWVRVLGITSFFFGVFLMILNVISLQYDPHVLIKDKPRMVEGYDYPIRSQHALEPLLSSPVDNFDYQQVNQLIYESVFHSDERTVSIYENWLFWFFGKLYSPLSRTQDVNRIVNGDGALCSEVAGLFNHIASLNGYDTRFIALEGHVVSEIKTSKGWRVIDPDFGIAYPLSHGDLQSPEGEALMRKLLTQKGFANDMIEHYVEVYQSKDDNWIVENPVILSPKLYWVESMSEYFKWIIPMILIVMGAFCLSRSRPCVFRIILNFMRSIRPTWATR